MNTKANQSRQGAAMVSYAKLKNSVIEIIDDFAKNDEVTLNYGTKYTAKSKLDKLGVTDPVRAIMPKRFNKVMRDLLGDAWRSVGSIDLVEKSTIGEMIVLACGQSGIPLPTGEPK